MFSLRLKIIGVLVISCMVEGISFSAFAQTRRPRFEPILPSVKSVELERSNDSVTVPRENDDRRHCLQDTDKELVDDDYFRLLVPDSPVGVTVEAFPAVLAYVPDTSASHVSVTVKRQRDGVKLYSSKMRIRPKSLNAIQLPDYLDPLVVGEQYLWSVSLLCEPVVLSYNLTQELVLLRQSPDLLPDELQDQLAVERAMSLGEMGIWYDMMSRLYFEAIDRRSADAMDNLKEIVVGLGIPLAEGDRPLNQ